MSLRYLLPVFPLRNLINNGAFLNNIRNTNNNALPTLCRSWSTTNSTETKTEDTVKKKKTVPIPKITLLSGDNLTITTLEEAQKLSKRRDLKLVKINDLDSKTQRPVYKMMTATEYHAEDVKQKAAKKELRKKSIKGEKVLMIGQNIAEHDLQVHINKIKKWVGKRYEVRIVINGDSNNTEKAESVYKLIENSLNKEARIVQKRQKGSDIKFQLLPPKTTEEEEKL
ncbi:unnamed protein product [Phyllotreta striolata]|uniref:Translation initiation factor IF-3 n=1 Tax=Phyllotreta striolata TaxID=444603 RepID=A0A9N9TL36_PHYSR|nr:unnamed protein product [Phyllotreta striolata]